MIFDADVLIWYMRGNQTASALIASDENAAISIVSYMEVLQGAKSHAEMATFRQFCRAAVIRVIPLTEIIGERAAELIEEHALKDGLRVADALVAATARQTGEVLVTGNMRHFRRIRNLTLHPYRPR